MRRWPRASPRSPIFATAARCCEDCSRNSQGSARSAPCRNGGAMCSSPTPRRSARPMAAKSCCSPTLSIAPMSAKTSTRRCACWSRADTASIFQGPRIAAGRCAAGGPSFRPGWSITPAPNWTGWSRPTRRSPRAACRSSASSRAACLTLRDELLSLRSDDDCQEHQRACAAVRGVFGARGRGRPAAAAARTGRRESRGARPLPPEIIRRVQAGRAGAAAGPRS